MNLSRQRKRDFLPQEETEITLEIQKVNLIIIPFPYAINQTFYGLWESFSCFLISFMQLMALLCSLLSSKVDT